MDSDTHSSRSKIPETNYDFDIDLQPFFEVLEGIKFNSWLNGHPHERLNFDYSTRHAQLHPLAIVFTDLVGSTKLLYEIGDQPYSKLLKVHYETVRKFIKLHQGYEVNTIGDGFLCAFILVADALNFALALHGNPGDDQLHVRVGIHYGNTRGNHRSGLCGQTIHFASRVTSQASEPEIWISDIAKSELERGVKESHLSISESGEGVQKVIQGQHNLLSLEWREYSNCILKGIPGEFCLWKLVH